LSEVRKVTDNWIIEYNDISPHDALEKMTPQESLDAQ